MACLDGVLTELLSGKAIVRSLDAIDTESERIRMRAHALCDIERRHHRAMGWFDAGKFAAESTFALIVVGVGVAFALHGMLDAGSVLVLFLLYGQVAGPLRDIHRMRDEANEAAVQTKRAFELMDEPEDDHFNRAGTIDRSRSATCAVKVAGIHAGLICFGKIERPRYWQPVTVEGRHITYSPSEEELAWLDNFLEIPEVE